MAKRATKAQREQELTIAHLEIRGQAKRIADLEERLREETEFTKDQIIRHEQHAVVLQGDRDVLTRATEVLSRRLVSPMADHDPARGGWRSGNLMATPRVRDEKATDPTPTFDPAYMRKRR